MGKKSRRSKSKDRSPAQEQAKKHKTSRNGGNDAKQITTPSDKPLTHDTLSAASSSRKKQNKHNVPGLEGNPFKTKLEAFLSSLTVVERESFFSDSLITPERRAAIWMQQADIGEDLVNLYSWAVPDVRCMAILKHFNPIVEVGCGANAYWSRQMKLAGIDVVAYDVAPEEGGRINCEKVTGKSSVSHPENDDEDFKVQRGGPEVLSEHGDRTLFLCYPDENDDIQIEQPHGSSADESMSLGQACLQYFEGDHIIHVGEIYGDTLSMAQAPWGRSSSPAFQQELSTEFHCVLKIPLQGWLHVRDSLTVWKRSETCKIVFATEGDEEEEEVEYRFVPVEERIPLGMVAPCLAHLISDDQLQLQESKARGNEETSHSVTMKKITSESGESKTESPAAKRPSNNEHDAGTKGSGGTNSRREVAKDGRTPENRKKRSSNGSPQIKTDQLPKQEKSSTETTSKKDQDDSYQCPW